MLCVLIPLLWVYLSWCYVLNSVASFGLFCIRSLCLIVFQRFRILQINKGDLVFPSFAIKRTLKIFSSRSDSIKYANAVLLEEEFQSAMENKDFDLALSVYRTAKLDVDVLCQKLKRPLEKSTVSSPL